MFSMWVYFQRLRRIGLFTYPPKLFLRYITFRRRDPWALVVLSTVVQPRGLGSVRSAVFPVAAAAVESSTVCWRRRRRRTPFPIASSRHKRTNSPSACPPRSFAWLVCVCESSWPHRTPGVNRLLVSRTMHTTAVGHTATEIGRAEVTLASTGGGGGGGGSPNQVHRIPLTRRNASVSLPPSR